MVILYKVEIIMKELKIRKILSKKMIWKFIYARKIY
jgi:hypothetical protein